MLEKDQPWRQSEFVVSYVHGRNYPLGTFHRASCRYLTVAKREKSYTNSRVYALSLIECQEVADRNDSGNEYRVCQQCCSDIQITGKNMKGQSK